MMSAVTRRLGMLELHRMWAEERLAAVALLQMQRPCTILDDDPRRVEPTYEYADEHHVLMLSMPRVRECVTFDVEGSRWVSVAVPLEVAASCVERIVRSTAAADAWRAHALRSLAILADPRDRRDYHRMVLEYNSVDPTAASAERREDRISMIADTLNQLRPFVSNRSSLLARGGLLAGSVTRGVTGEFRYDLFPRLDADEMRELERRVP